MLLAEVEKLDGGRVRDPENGLIMPWYTTPCLEWLSGLVLSRKRIFEYGAGDSTMWFREKGAIVYGVDNNADYVTQGIQLKTHFIEYCSAILNHFIPFDIVVIDGEWRDECTAYALENLKPGGLLIIDNYKQDSVPFVWTQTEKLIEGMPITLYKEPGHVDWVTAVITKP